MSSSLLCRCTVAALVLTAPLAARADGPQPTVPAFLQAVQPGIVVLQQVSANGQPAGQMYLMPVALMTPEQGDCGAAQPAQAKAKQKHPLSRCFCKTVHGIFRGPIKPMPVGCASWCAESTFLWGSCSAFHQEYPIPNPYCDYGIEVPGKKCCSCGK